jgi:O-antigen/teichoic acid export membrane protein
MSRHSLEKTPLLARVRRFGVVSRLGWGVADQGVSSLSNFAMGIIAARALGSEGFGAFTLAYVTYAFLLSATRGVATDPLVVRFSGQPHPVWRKAVAAASATSAIAGVAAGVVCVLVGLLMPSEIRGGFIALGIVLPALMLQDSWRFAFFAARRPAMALVNDLVWGAVMVAALVSLLLTGHAGVTPFVLAFGGSAAVAALFGLWQTKVRPRPAWVRAWVTDNRDLGVRYLMENVSIGGARQLRMFALGAFAGLAAVGDTRGAEILMGPFLVILMGASQVAVPEASQVIRRAPRRLVHFCLALGGVLASTAAVWGVVILLLLPTGLGGLLLGDIWVPASALLPAVIVAFFMGGFEIAAAAGVRALGAARRSLKAQLTAAMLYVVLGGVGAYLDGARGSAWGVAVATTAGTIVWWVQLRRALDEHVNASSGAESRPDRTDRIAT